MDCFYIGLPFSFALLDYRKWTHWFGNGKCDVNKACYRHPACLHLIMKWEINYTKTGILTLKLCDRINQTVFALFTSCLFSILGIIFYTARWQTAG